MANSSLYSDLENNLQSWCIAHNTKIVNMNKCLKRLTSADCSLIFYDNLHVPKQEIISTLVSQSNQWSLPLQSAWVEENALVLRLERAKVSSSVILTALYKGDAYGFHKNQAKHIKLIGFEVNVKGDITSHRAQVAYQHARRLFIATGYYVEGYCDEKYTDTVTVLGQDHYRRVISIVPQRSHHDNSIQILYGPVLDASTGQKAVISLEDYRNSVESFLVSSFKHRIGDGEEDKHEDYIKDFVNAIVTFQMLSVRLGSQLKLSMNCDGDSTVKRAVFVLYNFARLSNLLRSHSRNVDIGCYPPLPKIEHVEFELLGLEEEWVLIWNYVLVFPNVIEDRVAQFEKGKLLTQKVFHFVHELSRDFSIYYSRVHILCPPEPHLVETLSARIYLLRAVHHVFVNALSLLDVFAPQNM